MATYESSPLSGWSKSSSPDQSMRSLEFHCSFLPFSYRLSSFSRPSSYSQLKIVMFGLSTLHAVCSRGTVYARVLIDSSPPWSRGGAVGGLLGQLQPAEQLALKGALVEQC